MSSTPRKRFSLAIATLLAIAGPLVSHAQDAISEDFTQAATSNSWYFFNGACLTASTNTGGTNPGQTLGTDANGQPIYYLPGCLGIASSYYGENLVGGSLGYLGSSSAPGSPTAGKADPAGQGALRFTNGSPGGFHQNGAIVSSNTLSTAAGVQVTFKTVTYGGDNQGNHGADGISFYLMDGAQPAGIGAWGGSLAYSCSNSNSPHDGLVGGYIGLGMDEWGNFLNGVSDTLQEGANPTGDNTASGGGYQPGRIGMRGAGSIAWSWLNKTYPVYYPTSLSSSQQQDAVYNTCHDGVAWDYSNSSKPKQAKVGTSTVPVLDYPAIPGGWALPKFQIANEAAKTRPVTLPNTSVIAYKLKITQDGLLSLAYSYNGGAYTSVIAKQDITASNGKLPGSFRFGFAGSTGGSTNIHEILCFQASPSDQASTSIALDAKQAAKIANTTQSFLAYYYPSNWTGDLTANTLLYDPTTQIVSIASKANWDASCVLTGVPTGKTCATTTAAGLTLAQDPASRIILSWDGTQGIPFKWANLSSGEQSALDSGDSTTKPTPPAQSDRLNYLRGDRTNEVNTQGVGLFRPRESVLGDIVDSSPTWVGPPNSPFAVAWSDVRYPTAAVPEADSAAQTYAQFMSVKVADKGQGTRQNVVYAGANDGLLHGFRAGSFDANNNFVDNASTPNDGHEVLAYMPGATIAGTAVTSGTKKVSVVDTIHGTDPTNSNTVDSTLDYSSTLYGHNFYVDATPGTGDLFYAGAWHTWLVGGLGTGGAAIYALDITDPSTFTEGNAKSLVLGEWTSATISCASDTKTSSCGTSLGNTYGQPVIRRLHNGTWGAIFGNGFGSTQGDSGIFVMSVNSTTGARTFYYLSTGVSGKNGIAYVYPSDLDGDRIIDYVYAGDLLGHVWRFDLTSNDPTAWAASASPLFSTGSGQPITTRPIVWVAQSIAGGTQRVLVDFGTGQKTPITNSTPASYVGGTQYLYGIWDWNMDAWNAKAPSQFQYASLTSPQTFSVSDLTTQQVTVNGTELDGTNNPVCWKSSNTCKSGNTSFGWVLALPGTAEQAVFNPIAYKGAFVVNTTIPANNSVTSCANVLDTGDTIAISVVTGGAIPNLFPGYKDAIGFRTDGTGSVTTLNAGGKDYWLTQSSDGPGKKPPGVCNPPMVWSNGSCSVLAPLPGPSGKRLTWIQKR